MLYQACLKTIKSKLSNQTCLSPSYNQYGIPLLLYITQFLCCYILHPMGYNLRLKARIILTNMSPHPNHTISWKCIQSTYLLVSVHPPQPCSALLVGRSGYIPPIYYVHCLVSGSHLSILLFTWLYVVYVVSPIKSPFNPPGRDVRLGS